MARKITLDAGDYELGDHIGGGGFAEGDVGRT
jgi:hypothetical protein